MKLEQGTIRHIDARGRVTITGRKKEIIVLANGKNLYPEEIEAHYRTSPFVKEICVTTTGGDGGLDGDRLYAVVVPDMDVLRAKKIVNASALEKTARPRSAPIERVDGESLHGWSMSRLAGMSTMAPASIEPTAGSIGSSRSKLRPKRAAPA